MDGDERTRRRLRTGLASVAAGALIAVGVLWGAGPAVSAAGGTVRWYLVIPSSPGLKGESQVTGVNAVLPGSTKGTEIPLESWSWAVSPASTSIGSASSGAGSGKVTFSHLKMTRQWDANSPILFQDAVSGQHFKEVEILGVRTGVKGGTAPFMTLELGLAQFTAMSWNASQNAMPQEDLTLSFGAVRVSSLSGQAGSGSGNAGSGPVSGSWNRVTNNNNFNLTTAAP